MLTLINKSVGVLWHIQVNLFIKVACRHHDSGTLAM